MKLALGLVLALAACSVFKDGTASGRVESKGEAGDWVFETGKCFSGQREQFFGVVAFPADENGIGIKLVKDSLKGWTAMINRPETCKKGMPQSGCKAVVLTAEDCTKLEVNLDTTNVTVNDIKVVEGRLAIDCSNGPSSIKGQLAFTHCH